ncbi:polyketide cyclase [Aquicoccus sp. SCR17]|nr:polyketide cyclase [Carideicomes alvinocaridis]
MELDPKTDLSFTRTLEAPRDLIWECWTSEEHIPHWFIPRPHRIAAVEIDLRVGGAFNTTMEVEGKLMENRGVWLEVEPLRRLVFTDGYETGWKPAPDPFMTAIVEMEDAGEGRTLYTATARHRSADSAKRHEEMGFYDGWGTVADQLAEYARSLAK